MNYTKEQIDLMISEQAKRLALNSAVLPTEYQYIKSIIEIGPKRVRTIRPYYFQSPLNSIVQNINTNLYYYTDLTNDTTGTFTSNATLGNLPTNFLYFGNLYFMIYPPSSQAAAFQTEIGCTSYQKNAATIRSVQWVRLDAFDDGYNTYPTHTGTLFAGVNAWTKPNNIYEREKLLFHCAGVRVNTNGTGSVSFQFMVKFSGYQIETTEA